MKLKTILNQAQKLTKIFQPINVVPKNIEVKKHEITSISQKVNMWRSTGFVVR